jgi:hypothetical protein
VKKVQVFKYKENSFFHDHEFIEIQQPNDACSNIYIVKVLKEIPNLISLGFHKEHNITIISGVRLSRLKYSVPCELCINTTDISSIELYFELLYPEYPSVDVQSIEELIQERTYTYNKDTVFIDIEPNRRFSTSGKHCNPSFTGSFSENTKLEEFLAFNLSGSNEFNGGRVIQRDPFILEFDKLNEGSFIYIRELPEHIILEQVDNYTLTNMVDISPSFVNEFKIQFIDNIARVIVHDCACQDILNLNFGEGSEIEFVPEEPYVVQEFPGFKPIFIYNTVMIETDANQISEDLPPFNIDDPISQEMFNLGEEIRNLGIESINDLVNEVPVPISPTNQAILDNIFESARLMNKTELNETELKIITDIYLDSIIPAPVLEAAKKMQMLASKFDEYIPPLVQVDPNLPLIKPVLTFDGEDYNLELQEQEAQELLDIIMSSDIPEDIKIELQEQFASTILTEKEKEEILQDLDDSIKNDVGILLNSPITPSIINDIMNIIDVNDKIEKKLKSKKIKTKTKNKLANAAKNSNISAKNKDKVQNAGNGSNWSFDFCFLKCLIPMYFTALYTFKVLGKKVPGTELLLSMSIPLGALIMFVLLDKGMKISPIINPLVMTTALCTYWSIPNINPLTGMLASPGFGGTRWMMLAPPGINPQFIPPLVINTALPSILGLYLPVQNALKAKSTVTFPMWLDFIDAIQPDLQSMIVWTVMEVHFVGATPTTPPLSIFVPIPGVGRLS